MRLQLHEKVITLIFLVVTGAIAYVPVQAADRNGKERLAVLDLEAKYGVEKAFAEGLSVIVRDAIHSHSQYAVMSQEDIRAVANREQLMQAVGCDDGSSECLLDFGRAIGTRFMVAGSISKFGTTYTVSLRMLDTRGDTAGLVNRVSQICKCNDDDLIGTVEDLSARLLRRKTVAETKENDEAEKLLQTAITREPRKTEVSKVQLAKKNERLREEKEKQRIEAEQIRLAEEKEKAELEKEKQLAEKLLQKNKQKLQPKDANNSSPEPTIALRSEPIGPISDEEPNTMILRKNFDSSQLNPDAPNPGKTFPETGEKSNSHQEYRTIANETIKEKEKPETAITIVLRSEPIKVKEPNLVAMLMRFNFYEKQRNSSGSFNNTFLDNGQTITDEKTGLVWQKSGSSSRLSFSRAKSYVKKINESKFAGYSDWRLPTIEELASLIEEKKEDNMHVDKLFDKEQTRLWSSDLPDNYSGYDAYGKNFILNLEEGHFAQAIYVKESYTGGGTYSTNYENYVRAVRSLQ